MHNELALRDEIAVKKKPLHHPNTYLAPQNSFSCDLQTTHNDYIEIRIEKSHPGNIYIPNQFIYNPSSPSPPRQRGFLPTHFRSRSRFSST